VSVIIRRYIGLDNESKGQWTLTLPQRNVASRKLRFICCGRACIKYRIWSSLGKYSMWWKCFWSSRSSWSCCG